MQRIISLIVVIVISLFIVGCMPKSSIITHQPVASTYPIGNIAIFNADFNKTWSATVQSLAETSFTLTNISKDSKLITLNFSSVDTPSDYIDCGKITVQTNGKEYAYDVAARIAIYYKSAPELSIFGSRKYPSARAANLSGNVKILFIEESQNKTKVTVYTNYTLVAKSIDFIGSNHPNIKSETITFGNNESSNNKCTSKFTLEKQILNGIMKKLS